MKGEWSYPLGKKRRREKLTIGKNIRKKKKWKKKVL
jgi:hypothetical protein